MSAKIARLVVSVALLLAVPLKAAADTYEYNVYNIDEGFSKYNYEKSYETMFEIEEDLRYTPAIDDHAQYVRDQLGAGAFDESAIYNYREGGNPLAANQPLPYEGGMAVYDIIITNFRQSPVDPRLVPEWEGSFSPEVLTSLMENIHDNFLGKAQSNYDKIQAKADRTLELFAQIYNRHQNAVDEFERWWRFYCRQVRDEVVKRSYEGIHGAKWEPDDGDGGAPLAPNVTLASTSDTGALKRSLVGLYDCVKVRGGVWGYWIMSGPRKGHFVPVNTIDDPACLQGYCTCETNL